MFVARPTNAIQNCPTLTPSIRRRQPDAGPDHSPKINAALAHYSRFLAEHLDDPTIRMMVVARFMAFLNRTVLRMRDYRQTPIHFVGSISEVYQAPLREALSMLQLAPASVTAAPGGCSRPHVQKADPPARGS